MNGAVSLKDDLQGLDTSFNGRLVGFKKAWKSMFWPRPSQSYSKFSHGKLNAQSPNFVWSSSQMLYLPFPEELGRSNKK